MKTIFRRICVSTLFGVVYASCNEDDHCITNEVPYVASVVSPDNGIVNQVISVKVKFGVSNGCGTFAQCLEAESGNTRIIEVEAQYVGCI